MMSSRRFSRTPALVAVALTLVAAPAAPRTTAAAAGEQDVRWIGSFMEMIHQGRIEGRACLGTALAKPHAYALGALGQLDGEFIVLDGKARLSRPDRRGGVVSGTSSGQDSVTLMVYTHVANWTSIRLSRAISLAALQDSVAAYGARSGLPPGGPFAFLVDGTVSNLEWHVADGSKLPPGPSSHEAHTKAAVRGQVRNTTVSLLGFYSDHNAGDFLHHDSNVHVHVLLADRGLAAHVDDVTVNAGAVLRVPRVR